MSTVATLSPQALAEACAEAMWSNDSTSQRLGMAIERIAPGEATLSMEVTGFMLNGHGLAHGGFVFALADSAFAFACNGYNQRTVGHQAAITYIAPARLGDRLTAVAREVYRGQRDGIYDVHITNDRGKQVAEFRGHSRTVKGTHLPE
jgi:acyl-CoA thioesterase